MYSLVTITAWKASLLRLLDDTYTSHRTHFFHTQDTLSYLGHPSKILYAYVRQQLRVPFHQGIIEYPLPSDKASGELDGRSRKTIGGWVSMIYEALRAGELHEQTMACVGCNDEPAKTVEMGKSLRRASKA